MTQFMKKYMIQTLYMDAWDLGTFYIGDQLFLGVSQLGGKSFVIYKWDSEHRYAMIFFTFHQKYKDWKIDLTLKRTST